MSWRGMKRFMVWSLMVGFSGLPAAMVRADGDAEKRNPPSGTAKPPVRPSSQPSKHVEMPTSQQSDKMKKLLEMRDEHRKMREEEERKRAESARKTMEEARPQRPVAAEEEDADAVAEAERREQDVRRHEAADKAGVLAPPPRSRPRTDFKDLADRPGGEPQKTDAAEPPPTDPESDGVESETIQTPPPPKGAPEGGPGRPGMPTPVESRSRLSPARRESASKPAADEGQIGPPANPTGRSRGRSASDDFVGPPAKPIRAAAHRSGADDELVGPPARPTRHDAAKGEGGEEEKPKSRVTKRSTNEKSAPGLSEKGGKKSGGDVEVYSSQSEDMEWFNFSETPWEDVIQHFVDRVGKPWMNKNDVILTGELTYASDRKFTKDEAIDELNLILWEQGYRFVEEENHIYLVQLSEMSRKVDVKDVYASIEQFDEASPRPMDYVEVYIKVNNKPAVQVRDLILPFYNDSVTYLVAMPESNQIKFKGLARDVRRFVALKDKIDSTKFDPREFAILPIKTNAAEIERMVREILNLQTARLTQVQRDPRTGRPTQVQDAGNAGADESEVRMTADERTNSIIVKATKEKLTEIKDMIEKLDQRPDIKFETRVVKVKYANATDVANMLNQIFQQEQGAGTPAWQRAQQGRNPQQPQPGGRPGAQPAQPGRAITTGNASPEDILVEGTFERVKKTVRLVANERNNTLIVYANEDGFKRVEDALLKIDVPVESNRKTIVLENAKLDDVFPTVQQLLGGGSGMPGARPGTGGATRRATVLPDEGHNAIHVFAERDELQQIEELIKTLDVDKLENDKHLVKLTNLTASRAAQIAQALLANTPAMGGGPRSAAPGGRPARTGPSSVGDAQIIPLDESQTLLVICGADDWKKIEQTLKAADEGSISDTPVLEQFAILHGDPQQIAGTLNTFYRQYTHPTLGRSAVLVAAEGDKLYVQGVKPAVEEIRALLESLDVEPTATPIEILELKHADASMVAQLAQPIVNEAMAGRGGGGPRGAGSAGASVQADPGTNSLIVRADKLLLERIKNFAMEIDTRKGDAAPVQKFYTLKFADPREVSTLVTQVFNLGGGGSGGRGRVAGAQVTAFASGAQVMVEAPQDKLDDIDGFIAQVDSPKGPEILIKTVKAAGADVASIAARLTQAFAEKKRQQPSMVARFDADPQSETVLATISKDIEPDVDRLWTEFQKLSSERPVPITDTRKMPGVDVNNLAAQLQRIFQQRPRPDKQPVNFAADAPSNTLIISAPKDAFVEIDDLIGKLTKDLDGLGPDQRVFAIKNADANYVADQLKQVLTVRAGKKYGAGVAGQTAVIVDSRQNRITVDAPKAIVEMADALVKELDVRAADDSQVQIVALENADANAVLNNLRTVFGPRMALNRNLQLTVEPMSNSIMIAAAKADADEIRALAMQLDGMVEGKRNEPKIYPIKNADPNEVAQELMNRFAPKGGQRPGPGRETVVSVFGGTNLMVQAPAKNLTDIEEVIRTMETAAAEQEVAPRTIALKNADPNQVLQMINAMFGLGAKNKSQSVNVVVANNSLIVKAPISKLKQIEDLVNEVDQPDLNGVTVKTFQLKVLNAQTVAQQVSFFLATSGALTKSGSLKPGAFGEPNTNTLVVLAPPSQMPFIEKLIADFESTPIKAGKVEIYDLKFARAEQIGQNVKAMLDAKVVEREGGKKGTIQTVVTPDPSSNRLVVYAPAEYQSLVSELLAMVDKDSDTGEVTHLLTLDNSDAQQMADVISKSLLSGNRGSASKSITVAADPNSNTLLLRGMPREVAEIEKVLEQLEATSQRIPEMQIYQTKNIGAATIAEAITGLFPQSRNPSENVTITTDETTDRLFITANRKLMRRVEAYIKQLDVLVEDSRELYFVDIFRGDAADIAWNVRGVLPDEDKGGPSVDSDWYGEYITVRCRPSEYARIEKLIRDFEAREKPQTKTVVVNAGTSDQAAAFAKQMILRDPSRYQVEESAPKAPKRKTLVEEARPKADKPNSSSSKGGENGSFHPFQLGSTDALTKFEDELGDLIDVSQQDGPPAQPKAKAPPRSTQPAAGDEKKAATPKPAAPKKADDAVAAPKAGKKPEEISIPKSEDSKTEASKAEPAKREKPKVTVKVTPEGQILLDGPKSEVEALQKELDEFLLNQGSGEVIRIFRFNFGDVNAASQILDRMFNERAVVNIPQQQQQQGRNNRQGGRAGEEEDPRGGGNSQLDQLRNMIGGGAAGGKAGAAGGRGGAAGGGTRIRIATDAGNNFLIVKCNEVDLPEIRELLYELDIPPGEVQIKVFQLKNLDASETAGNIREVLGIGASTGRSGPAGGARPQQGGNRDQLLQILQEQMAMVQIPGGEGGVTKIESAKIVANAGTNSIMVSSPPDVMKIIENTINELEAKLSREEVLIETYQLEKAKAETLVPLLQDVFGSRSGGGRAEGLPGRGRSVAGMGPVTFREDIRNNTIIFSAERKDVERVRAQIAALDIEDVGLEAQTVIVKWGRADSIAAAVEEIFAETGRAGGRVGGGERGGSAGNGPKIVAEPTTNSITVFGSPDQRKKIFAKIREFDEQSRKEVQEINVQFADAEKLATKLNTIFASNGRVTGGTTSGAENRTRRGAGGAAGARRAGGGSGGDGDVLILGDKDTKKLYVRAPKEMFDEIADMAERLDQSSEMLQVQNFPLQYADAEAVYESVRQAMMEYMQLNSANGGENDFDAFTVLPDTRTNSLMVVGTPITFAFIDKVLSVIDVETPASQQTEFRSFPLTYTESQVVADAINQYASGSSGGDSARRSGGGQMGGGRRGGLPSGGGGGGTGKLLNVQAVAETATNTVLVFGRPRDIEKVKVLVIDEMEDAQALQIVRVPVESVPPSQLVGAITQALSDATAGSESGGGRSGGSVRRKPQLIPNDTEMTIVVRGTARQIEEVRDLAVQLDSPDFNAPSTYVLEVPGGQDAEELARTIQDVVNKGEQAKAKAQNRPSNEITITGEPGSNAIIVYGDAAAFHVVKTVLDQLASVTTYQPVTEVVRLTNLSAQDAQDIIDSVQSQRGGRSGAGGARRTSAPRRTGGSSGGGSRAPSTPSGGESGGTRAAPPTRQDIMNRIQQGGGGGGGARPGNQGGQRPSNPGGGQRQGNPGGGQRPVNPGGGGGSSDASPWKHKFTQVPDGFYAYQSEPTDDLVVFGLDRHDMAGPFAPLLAMLDEELDAQQDQPTSKPAKPKPGEKPAAGGQPVKKGEPAAKKDQPAKKTPGQLPDKKPAKGDERVIEKRDLGTVEEARPRTGNAARDAKAKDAGKSTPVKSAQTKPAEEPVVETDDDGNVESVSGSLKGEVNASPLDSQTVVITGDASDVDYIKQLLSLMESQGGHVHIRVFKLQNQKANTMKQTVDTTIRGFIDQTGAQRPSDRVTINAETRSNSLIVSANDVNMKRIEQIIDTLDTETSPTQSLVVRVEHVPVNEAVGILTPAIEQLNKIRGGDQASQASIQAVERDNSIMIVGTEKDIAEIQQLITTIDVEVTGPKATARQITEGRMIILPVKNGSADDIAKVMTDMIKAEQEGSSAGGGGAGARRGGPPKIKTLRLTLADGTELPELNLERAIKIIAEKGTNSLIIYSSKENNEALREMVSIFDTLPVGEDTDVRAFVLKHGSAEQIAKVVQDVMDKGKAALRRPVDGKGDSVDKGVLPPVPPGVAPKGLPYQVSVQHDPRSNTILVVGRKDAVLLAAGLIKELDVATADLGMKSHVMALQNQQAGPMAERVNDVLKQRSTALGGDKNTARDSAVVVADERSNSLLILAADDMFTMVRDLVTQIDIAPKATYVDTRLRRAKYADVQKLAGMIQQVFDKKIEAQTKSGGATKGEQKDSLSIFGDSRSNSLVMTGTRDFLSEADKLIDEMDQAYEPSAEFTVRPLKLGSAVSIAAQLKEMIEKSMTQKDSKITGTPMYVAADARSNSLLLAGSREDLVSMERWIQILDRPAEGGGRMIRVFPLRRGNAEQLSKSVGDLFKQSGGGTSGSGGGQDLTVTNDVATNSIIAVGPPGVLNEIEDMIVNIESNNAEQQRLIRVFKLEQADADAMAELIQNVLTGRGGTAGGGRTGGSSGSSETSTFPMVLLQRENQGAIETLKALRSDISVTADMRTNSIVVTATPESMPLMESLIMQLDGSPETSTVKVFRLINSDAEQMVNTLQDIFDQRGSSGSTGGSTRGGSTTGDAERTLSLGEGGGGRQDVRFSAEKRTNSVIAEGTPGYLHIATQLIEQLDNIPIQDRVVKVYEPRSQTAESLAAAIKQVSDEEKSRLDSLGDEISQQRKQEREIGATSSKDANRVVLTYDPRFEDNLMKVVNDLDQPPPQVMIQVVIVEVTLENTLDLGVEWAFQDLQYQAAGPTDTNTFDYVGGTDLGAAANGLSGFAFTITGADFNFLLRTLQSESSLNVLSRPQVTATANQEANFEVANDVPYVNSTSTSSGGQVSTSVSRSKVGITLKVTPENINPDGFVRMKIRQEVSEISPSTVEVGPGTTAPIFFTRNVDTTVTVKDGETVVLGGLINSRTEKTETKVPLLGDIPGLGVLFRNQTDTFRKAELLVILTPRVIRSVEDFSNLSKVERDRGELINGDDILTSPLLDKLRVDPEDLKLRGNQELDGAKVNKGAPDDEAGEGEEEYGPGRPEKDASDEEISEPTENTPDPDSYDVPVRRFSKRT